MKYIHKYIFKGHDRTVFEVEGHDEIRDHIDGRFLEASEAAWRIFHFSTHGKSPNVVRLEVHLPSHHLVHFDPDEDMEAVMERASNEATKLAGFFKANYNPGEIGKIARQLTYQGVPTEDGMEGEGVGGTKERLRNWEDVFCIAFIRGAVLTANPSHCFKGFHVFRGHLHSRRHPLSYLP